MTIRALSITNCPIKLKVCHYACYWRKKGKCVFPPGGYNRSGQPVRKKK